MAPNVTRGESGPSLAPDQSAESDFGIELAELELAVASGQRRSADRRAERHVARRKRITWIAGLAAVAAAATAAAATVDWDGVDLNPDALLAVTQAPPAPPPPDRAAPDSPERIKPEGPDRTLRDRMESAEAWVAGREGSVAIAVVGAGGERRGRGEHELFPSASVVKSMLLVGELRRLRNEGLPLDPGTESTLAAMIEYSDNEAADAIYARVGDEGLLDVAKLAGMRDFEVDSSWGYAQISAADMALLFSRLDRVLPARDREFAKGLLGSVVAEQSWGIPAAASGWSARFKGGWRTTETGQLVSQVAELRRDGRAISLAVLTDGQPSMEYGIETVEGVAERIVPAAPSGG